MSPAAAGPVAAVLDAGGAHLAARLGEVEARVRAIAGGDAPDGDVLDVRALRTVAAGGKRLRPLLLLLCAGPAVVEDGPVASAAVGAGAALELVHAATLVHDDVLDAADLRRGRATVWSTDGRAAATSVGDLLFGRAFGELAAVAAPGAVLELSVACRALATGELLQREDAWRTDVPEERYLRRCGLKTGALFGVAARIGAGLAGEAPEALGRFGEAVGVAFQLLDDVLDVTGPAERTGKPRGTDLLDGTATLPLLVARDADPQLAALDLRSLDGPAAAAAACDRIVATGAVAATERRALAMVDAAVDGLPAGLDAARGAALRRVARGVVEREL